MHKTAVNASGAHLGDGLGKAAILQTEGPVIGDICRSKVRKGARTRKPTVEIDAMTEFEGVLPAHADASHARLDGEMVLAHLVERRGALTIGKGELGRVDARHDVVLNEGLDALHRRLGEDEDRPGDACTAQLEALLHRGDGELVRAGGMHDLHALDGAVSIGIRLDDGHHAHARLELLL